MTKDELVKGVLARLGVVGSIALSSGEMGSTPIGWRSGRFGPRCGQVVLDAGDGWRVIHDSWSDGLTWVREELIQA